MDEYTVKLYPRAQRDLDEIYAYIAEKFLAPGTALAMVDTLEEAILSLGQFPERGHLCRRGSYSGKGYRQLLVKNYLIVYRVHKEIREVHIVTVRYKGNSFLLP